MSEFVLFRVCEFRCGLSIGHIREINKNVAVTAVHTAPPFVHGVINLRGEIVTLINVHRLFGLGVTGITRNMKNIVVHWGTEVVGLLVDDVDDILVVGDSETFPPPPHLTGPIKEYATGVFQERGELVALLDVDRLLLASGTRDAA